MTAKQKPDSGKSNTRSIRAQLVLAVNSVLLLFVVGFLVFDYQRDLAGRFAEKTTSLQDEAKTLLPGVLHLKSHGQEAIQKYVDDVCARMNDFDSPGHHIVVELDGALFQAHAHHRASNDLVSAMRQGAASDFHRIQNGDMDLAVGMHSQSGATVLVSEDVKRVRWEAFSAVLRRMWGLLLMGLVAAAIVNMVLVRIVTKPLQILIEKVREVGKGDFVLSDQTRFGTAELDYLATEIHAMSEALAASELERTARLNKARRIQENLLPKEFNFPGISVGTIYCPAEEVGGDYFDILPLGDRGTLVCMADATDHGVPAAMMAAMLKTLLLHAKDELKSPAEILADMNRSFMEVNLFGDFATIILLQIDLDKQQVTFANAGHDPVWLIESDGKVIEMLPTGTVLGIDVDSVWENKKLALADGARIAISTDGITETFDINDQQFGKERLIDLLLASKEMSAARTAELVQNSVERFRDQRKQHDDVTLLLLDLTLTHKSSQAEVPIHSKTAHNSTVN